MPLDKNAFDAAGQAHARAALADSSQALRHAEQESFSLLLDADGNFLPDVSHQRDCPLCGASHAQGIFVLRAHGMKLLRCPACKLVYSREVIKQELDHQRYQPGDTSTTAFIALKENPVYAQLAATKSRYVVERLSSLSGTGKLLEIGASTGTLLKAAKDAGWDAYGVELNPAAVNQCQSQNLKVVCGAFPCELPASWDITQNAGGGGGGDSRLSCCWMCWNTSQSRICS